MSENTNERQTRLKKLNNLIKNGVNPYPDKFLRAHSLAEAKAAKTGAKVTVAGRLMLIRDMGKICFAHVLDNSGKMQIVFKMGEVEQADYDFFAKNFDVGDFIGVEGEIFTTQKGEISILVKKFKMLAKALLPLPEKWHGIQDTELKYRERYLDLIMSPESKERFMKKIAFIKTLREFLDNRGYVEIETPVLATKASGAIAKPFTTHHNALDIDLFLRIAPETYLKRAIVGGFERVYEFARCFRNEGIDPSHLQEFTMLEFYEAYSNFEDLMKMTESMLAEMTQKVFGTAKFEIKNREGVNELIDFTPPYPRATIRDLIEKACGIDIAKIDTAEELIKEIKNKKIKLDASLGKMGRGNIIDVLYKKVARPKIKGPLFLINHPIDLSPLARRNEKNPDVVDRFQLVVNGWEIVNAYSELVDPVDQRQRLEDQTKLKAKGDEEAMETDEDFLLAMEHGMPPMAGWGMGIERLIALLTKTDNIKDCVMFPLMRQENKK